MSAAEAKAQGNEHYNQGRNREAIEAYTRALDLTPKEDLEARAILYKNRAAAYLKTSEFEKVVEDCDQAVQVNPIDSKALFRRGQAYESLGKTDLAFEDMKKICEIDKGNKAAAAAAARLYEKQQRELVEKMSQLKINVKQQMEIVMKFKTEADNPKAIEAAGKLAAAASEGAYSKELVKEGLIPQILHILQDHPLVNPKVTLALLQTLHELVHSTPNAELIANIWESEKVKKLCAITHQDVRVQTLNLMASMAEHVSREEKEKLEIEQWDRQRVPAESQKKKPTYTQPLLSAKYIATVPQIAMEGFLPAIISKEEKVKTAALNGVIKVVNAKEVALAFMKSPGFELVLKQTSSELKGVRPIASLALSKIFNASMNPKLATEICQKILGEKLDSTDFKEREDALIQLTSVCQADAEVGATIIKEGNLIHEWMDMIEFDSEPVVVATLDALSAAASDKGMRKLIASECVEWLNRLVLSSNMRYKIRAAITLTKSLAINPESRDQLVDGTTDTSEIILQVLSDKTHALDVRQAAVEGLAYLSVYAPMKEKVVSSKPILDTLFELSKIDDKALQYGITSTLANMASYLPKLTEEQQQLMKLKEMAKEYVPKTHPMDEDSVVEKRVAKLVAAGAVSAMVSLSKTPSANIRESLSNVFLSMATDIKNRGLMVQQGGVPALLRLANEGTERGREVASQALAKIAITMDPNIAFKGERAAELVRPLLKLLNADEGLLNFESLLALTNLASMSEEIRTRVLKEKGLRQVEFLMFSENEMIQRAATECMCNLMFSEEVFNLYAEAESSEKLRIFIGLSDVEDFATKRAASGCLAILSSSEKACRHLKNEKLTLEIFVSLLGDHPELQHRVLEVLKNMSGYPDLAQWLVESGLKDPIQILSFSENPHVKEAATACFKNLEAVASK